MLPVVDVSSGASEFLRLVVESRGRFSPAADLGGCFWALEVVVVDFWDFFEGASGAGHSTSWARSRRSEGIHSDSSQYMYSYSSWEKTDIPSSRLLNSS